MKRSTAIKHLVEMADGATERLRFRGTEIGWPLEELWVGGDLLGPGADIDAVTVVVVLDLPSHELPWLAVHPTAEWVGDLLRLGKRPTWWNYRPTAWPAWTYRNPRLVRFWSAPDGLDQGLIDRMQAGAAIDVREPSNDEFVAQLTLELEVSEAHLRSMLSIFWDREWRRGNHHDGGPEDRLWRAASAVMEIREALEQRTA